MGFEDKSGGPVGLMKSILFDFTEWMNENGYEIGRKISYWEYFGTSGITHEYDSVEQAYGVFKRMIQGFIAD